MIYATRRPRHRKHAGQFPFGSIFHEVVNAPVKDVIKEEKKKYTYPAANVVEFEDKFVLDLTVPGFKKKEINITIDKNELIISSDKEVSDEVKYTRKEFEYGTFNRKFRLPDDVNTDKISAKFTNGILTITIPKMEEVKPTKIEIK